jgi:hypothetical protein
MRNFIPFLLLPAAISAQPRPVVPAGRVVEGYIAEIGGVPEQRRLKVLLSGNFTAFREVRSQYGMLVLPNGTRLPLHTALARGNAQTSRIAGPKKGLAAAKSALQAFRAPGELSQ